VTQEYTAASALFSGWKLRELRCKSKTLPRRERYMGIQQSGAAIALYDDEPCEPDVPLLQAAVRAVPMPVREFPPPEDLEAQAQTCRTELNRLRQEGKEDESKPRRPKQLKRAGELSMPANFADRK